MSESRRYRRPIFLAVSAAVFVAVVLASSAVILPFVMAIVIAYVFTPAVAWVEKKRVPRVGAILIVYALVLGSIGLFVRIVMPRMVQEVSGLRSEIPALAKKAKTEWIPAFKEKLADIGIGMSPAPSPPPEVASGPRPADIVARPQPDGSVAIDVGTGFAIRTTEHGYVVEPLKEKQDEGFDPEKVAANAVGKTFDYAQHNALEIVKIGRDVVASISRAIFLFFITLMLAAYIMMTREKIMDFIFSLVRPSTRPGFAALLERMDRGLSGVIRGQLMICVVNGVLSAIGFAIVGLKYWPVLAIVAMVLSLIPIFGSIVSTIPAVAIGLTQGLGTAVFVLLWVIGIHQLEANFLNPKIMGDSAKIHPVLVVFSLLVGEHFFGTVGALLAVPCMAIAKSLFLHFRDVTNQSDPELCNELHPSTVPPPSKK